MSDVGLHDESADGSASIQRTWRCTQNFLIDGSGEIEAESQLEYGVSENVTIGTIPKNLLRHTERQRKRRSQGSHRRDNEVTDADEHDSESRTEVSASSRNKTIHVAGEDGTSVSQAHKKPNKKGASETRAITTMIGRVI
ncbi:hypothetical protein LTR95_002187 [Oleoguttula sp. CCFEE 5521]